MTEDWIAERELIARPDVGRRRRLRWLRDEGLIPTPRKRSRGLHKGTASYYPPVTVAMLDRIKALAEVRRDADEWAWHLWIEGFPVTGIGERLAKHLDRLQVADIANIIKSREALDDLLTKAAAAGKKRRLEVSRGHAAAPIFGAIRNKDAGIQPTDGARRHRI